MRRSLETVSEESEAILRWTESFAAVKGRKPRVLHIGNIANNAWQNAKLMRQLGFECDVICYDYYHCMGAPEWDEADFDSKEIGDHFAPQWHRTKLNGFRRPEWFVQGRQVTCIRYLCQDDGNRRAGLWKRLMQQNATAAPGLFDSYSVDLWRRRIRNRVRRLAASVVVRTSGTFNRVKQWANGHRGRPSAGWVRAVVLGLLGTGRMLGKLLLPPGARELEKKLSVQVVTDDLAKELMQDFARRFPERSDRLSHRDFTNFLSVPAIWMNLLSRYDVIQGYATDPIIPMLCQVPFFAFEHGTLRDIPFEDSPRGRLTALAYSRAEQAFVTNADCVEKGEAICGKEKATFINHPFDERHLPDGQDAARLRAELCKSLGCDKLVFFPTRNDWVKGTGYADKGNDVFLRAVRCLREDLGIRVGVVLCEWGKNVRQSKQLIGEMGYEKATRWVAPMAGRRFIVMCMAADLVVDQFILGAFGGVLFKSLAAGAPVCTYLDEGAMLARYGEAPPVVNCRTTEEVVEKVGHLFRSEEAASRMRAASKAWIERYHSGMDTASTQARYYIRSMEQGRTPWNAEWVKGLRAAES